MIELADFRSEFNQLREPLQRAVLQVLESGQYILGPKVNQLERELSVRMGNTYTLGVANGTDALLLALEALEIGSGHEVITTPFSFFATVETILRAGAKAVFVDIEPDTFNINPELLESAVTERTKAIIPVHLFGQCSSMEPILEFARRRNLYVIEDACQAFGATYQGMPAGTIGDVGCFSFYPSKNLGAFGDAGLVVTQHEELYENMMLLRNHGSRERYIHHKVGMNSRLDEIQAAVLLVKLQALDQWISRRNAIAKQYTRALSGSYQTPVVRPDRNHAFYLYSLQHPGREGILACLKQNEIQAQVYYPLPLHLQPALADTWRVGDFPVAERVAKEIFSIPVHPAMTDNQVNQVIHVLLEFAVKQSWNA